MKYRLDLSRLRMNRAMALLPINLDGLFRAMEIADDLLTQSGHEYPDGAFRLMFPTEPIRGLSEAVIRAHMVELLRRIRKGTDTRPATNAEILGALSRASLKAPLDRTGTGLALYLAEKVIGYDDEGSTIEEAYPGEYKERLAVIRKKFSVPDRVLGKEEKEVA